MSYKNVYFDEEKQKVKWTKNSTTDLPLGFKYVGQMNRVEFDVLIDLLWDIYQDEHIPYTDFKDVLDEFRHFIDSKKTLFKK